MITIKPMRATRKYEGVHSTAFAVRNGDGPEYVALNQKDLLLEIARIYGMNIKTLEMRDV